ncbi:MAG TPA: glycosyltransferase family 39 protein [Gaiellaceae bacterium]|nr:glycosyltransferase family 39 protein [Gaiellaceae bacterium]
MRIFAVTRLSTLVVLSAAVLPRLAVLLRERDSILASFTEKSDDFAQVFVSSGTYGFAPGFPSAYTQPLYGWFLIPLYWIDRNWAIVGIAQIAVAAATAYLVLTIGRKFLTERAGVVAALLATLNPYLVWHDVHVNRELLDQVIAAALFLLVLLAARAGSLWLVAATGAVSGLAVLGNSRLAGLPLMLAVFIAWHHRHRALTIVGVLLACTVLVALPWAARNKVQVGCWAITTDGKALWKANNVNTYRTLKAGKWIDDVPALPGAPTITPEYQWDYYRHGEHVPYVDECAQMRLYQHATFDFWRHHPGEKLKLMVQATEMLWSPKQTRTQGGPEATAGAWRQWLEAVWAIPVYLLALIGLFLVPRRFAALALTFLAYNTAAAWVFAGATRYRVSFDFVLALLAGAAIERLWSRLRYTASTPSAAAPAEN